MKSVIHGYTIDPYAASSFKGVGPYCDPMGMEDLSPVDGVDFTSLGLNPSDVTPLGEIFNGISGCGEDHSMGSWTPYGKDTMDGLKEMVDKVPGGYITLGGVALALVGGVVFFMTKGKKKKKR